MAFVDLCNFTDWPMGGMVRYELMILETLEQYYDIDLWGVSVDGEASQNIIINNKPYPLHIFANAKRKNRVIPNYWKGLLVKKFESCFLNYDIIYVHTGSCLLALAHVAQVENALLVYHQHGLQYLEDYSLKTLLQKPFMNKAQKLADCSFVVTAKQELEEYTNGKKGYLQEKLIAIGSPVEERKLNWNKVAKRVEDRRDKREYRFIYSGRLAPIKNVSNLIEIFAMFCKRGYEKSSLWIVGDGEERDIVTEKIKQFGLQEVVFITGMVNPEKVQEYMMQSDFYITASNGEGVSVAVLEAYSAGLPVVCYPVRGLKYQVKDAQTGFVAQGMKSEDFVDAMENAIKNQSNLVHNCLLEAMEFRKEKIGREIVDEIEKRQNYAFDKCNYSSI